ncbi:hypothetical protein ACJMK2_007502 [Sinanodonta woodiana]|uniref:Fibronectin type-III domain-containing protein n=1 Tax=Sinanodonta woodiana TaxID=1069815 RepID=A0ABD3VKA1_SINWO
MFLSTLQYMGILYGLFSWPQFIPNRCQAAGQNISSNSYPTRIYSIIPPKLNSNQPSDSHLLSGPNQPMLSDLDITWVNSSMSSITIQWRVTSNQRQTYFLGSEVECIIEGGKFISNMLQPDVNQFTIQNLHVGTTYSVCVRVFAQEKSFNMSNASHYKCITLETLGYVRKDSILWMSLILGYYIFMGLLGYTQWRRKLCEISKRNKMRNANTAKNEHAAAHWKDLEERTSLMQPGCSKGANK